ncbi:histidine kinase [Cohnella sp. CIP 111063]|uniref:cache domain-containing sensor histidine kinase n=1 Tax=unclassified Cohnella TaxID=2636738 RepID=UPI000B8BE1AB|nr:MULTISPECIES: sensor histidine kinase [unclassified Cohnella]OXS53059.1 histidine kinase [Cohnella sp. CIP 111063]PRX60565.1 two-component system sensor histidine kinase YesM [Cohnella sp. SGD-V74]
MRLNLSRKLFLYFFIVILFSLSMVGIFSYLESSDAIDKQVEKYMATVINNAGMQTDLQLETFERVSNSILSQVSVKKFLDMDPADSYEYYRFTNVIRQDVFQKIFITYPTQIHMMYILGDHGRSIFDQNQSFSSLSVDPTARYEELKAKTPGNGEIAILGTGLTNSERVITIARKIRGYSSYSVKGILAIEMNERQLSNLWNQVDLGDNGFFFILDAQGAVVYAPDGAIREELLGSGVAQRIEGSNDSRFPWRLNGKDMMIVTKRSDYSGWSLAIAMPLDELRAPISGIRSTTVTVGAITLAIALVLALQFASSIVRPIRTLKNGMRETEKGNWKSVEMKPRDDEIGGLIHSYNLMVSRLSDMIERVYDTELTSQKTKLQLQAIELERHKAEFQALQLQINPHFLYNTLETINCYAIVQDSDEISEMVEAMAFMLRYSIQTNLEEVTLANELNHVRNYMIIQKHRIGRDFEIEVATPPSLLLSRMVRLTLQPIVENIFQHAFSEGIEPEHTIRIDTYADGNELLVLVEDNGVGMSEARLEELRRRLGKNRLAEEEIASRPGRRGGIGLVNVHRRIQMVYGDEYGLRVDSAPGKGTRIELRMPQEDRAREKTRTESA